MLPEYNKNETEKAEMYIDHEMVVSYSQDKQSSSHSSSSEDGQEKDTSALFKPL